MIEFALPWAFALLPLPVLAWWLLSPAPETGRALRIPFFTRLAGLPHASGEGHTRRGTAILLAKSCAWLLLVAAAAQPQWVGPAQPVPTQGRDLMLALDLSGSMATPDFAVRGRAVDRFRVVQAVARDFTERRQGDRVGLVLFGSRAFLQAPVTRDLAAVATLIDESEVGLAGQETAIGDAIGLAVKHLKDRPADERVLVLLSDGASNTGALTPEKAAELARDAKVRIYTIGVGGHERIVSTLLGQRVVGGNGDLDEATLRAVAETTGGRYFRADDTETLLQTYAEIDRLEPTEGAGATVRPLRALFHVPLAGALTLAGLLAAARPALDALSLLTWRRVTP